MSRGKVMTIREVGGVEGKNEMSRSGHRDDNGSRSLLSMIMGEVGGVGEKKEMFRSGHRDYIGSRSLLYYL